MSKEPLPGPYNHTTTKTVELAPIKFTVTERTESSHVPPAKCGCGGGGSSISSILDYLQQYAAQYAASASPTAAPDPEHAPDRG